MPHEAQSHTVCNTDPITAKFKFAAAGHNIQTWHIKVKEQIMENPQITRTSITKI
jgi:hypothetical protein